MGIEYKLPSDTWTSPPDSHPSDEDLVELFASERGNAKGEDDDVESDSQGRLVA